MFKNQKLLLSNLAGSELQPNGVVSFQVHPCVSLQAG